MMNLYLNKAVKTNQITRDEAYEWFDYLKAYTNQFVKFKYNWYVKKGFWPIKAQRKNKADRKPKFIVNHHTGGTKTGPAFARFSISKMASANFLIERNGNIIYFVDIHNMSFHATLRTWLPISLRRRLNIRRGWLNEPGIETVGNGTKYLFRPEQFRSIIALQRYLVAYYPSIEEIKSHRFFSPKFRAGDPGYLYFLPLVEHAIFHDVDLDNPNYWLKAYEKDPIEFANNVSSWMSSLFVLNKDEWKKFRTKRITEKNILIEERNFFVKKT